MAYEIRSLTPDETATAVSWAHSEGWKPGLHDMNAFLTVDPSGFLGGFLDGKLAAVISAIRYPGDYAFVGFYIVRPEHRGTGLGIAIWNKAMEQLRGCNMGLDGVIAQVHNYAKSGFKTAHQNRRYMHLNEEGATVPMETGLIDARAIPLATLSAFDRRFFPADRTPFLASWLSQPGRTSRALIVDNRLVGYGVMRPCDGGCRVGPLFAESPAGARSILQALMTEVAGTPVYIDIPVRNNAALSLVEGLGMTSVFDTARMYSRREPALEHEGIFGITSLELG